MEKKEKDCGLLIAVLLVGVAFGVVAGVVVLSLFYPAFQSDKWAAWVQAIGSVLAVFTAIYVSHRQYKNSLRLFWIEEKRRKEKEKEKNKEKIFSVMAEINRIAIILDTLIEQMYTLRAIDFDRENAAFIGRSKVYFYKNIKINKNLNKEVGWFLIKSLLSKDRIIYTTTQGCIDRIKNSALNEKPLITYVGKIDSFLVRCEFFYIDFYNLDKRSDLDEVEKIDLALKELQTVINTASEVTLDLGKYLGNSYFV